jgi:multidrug efflux pump subunit AcrA (membrane-fusion protein)
MLNLSGNYKGDKKEKEYSNMQSNALLTTPKHIYIIRTWMRWIIVVIIAFLFLPWQQNIQGYGRVIPFRPQDRPQVVPSVIAGRIEKWAVREGQKVKKGDTLVVISE